MMDEQYTEQEERENLSGADLAECYEWHEKNRMILDGLEVIGNKVKGLGNECKNSGCVCESTKGVCSGVKTNEERVF
jgi:hypothetical protein